MSPTTPALRRLGRRILQWLGLTVAALAVVFIVLDALPGDAASQMLGNDATPEALAALRADYGLDRPVIERLGSWLAGLTRGDLGTTLVTQVPVSEVLGGAVWRTGVLAASSGIFIVTIGWGLATAAGTKVGSMRDRVIGWVSLASIATPEFVLATVLVLVFSTMLGWLPAVSLVSPTGSIADRPHILVLPVATMVLVGSGSIVRLVRPIVAREAAKPHVEAARLAGHPWWRVWFRHLLPGAMAPAAQASAAVVPYMVGGTVVIERAFAYPGLGSVMISAVGQREPNLLMGCALVIVSVTAAAFRLADVVSGRSS